MWVVIQKSESGNMICGYFRVEELAHRTAAFCRDHGMSVTVSGSEAGQMKLALSGGRVSEATAMVQVRPTRRSIEERRTKKAEQRAAEAFEGGRSLFPAA